MGNKTGFHKSSNISTQKQSSCKKGAVLCKMTSMKKVVKYRWQLRNDCDGSSGTKNLIMTIQVKFVPTPSEHCYY